MAGFPDCQKSCHTFTKPVVLFINEKYYGPAGLELMDAESSRKCFVVWIKDEIAAAFEKDMLSEMRPPLIMCERVLALSIYLVSAVLKT